MVDILETVKRLKWQYTDYLVTYMDKKSARMVPDRM